MDDFDPKKYLAEKTGGTPGGADDFDPKKYLAEKTAAPEEQGFWESAPQAALKGVQNVPTFGFGDKLGALEQAALLKASGDPSGFGANYDQALAENRRDDEAAKKANPLAYYGTGIAVAAPVMAAGGSVLAPFEAAEGAGLAARVGAGVGNGVVQGGLSGLGYDDTGDVGSKVMSTLKGGVIGGGVGGALPVAGTLAGKAAGGVGDWLEQAGIAQGRRAIGGTTNSLSSKAALPDAVVRRALEEKHIPVFGSVEKIAENLGNARQEAGEHVGEILSGLEDYGVAGPNKAGLVQKLKDRLANLRESGNVDPRVRSAYSSALDELQGVPARGPEGILTPQEQLVRDVESRVGQMRAQGHGVRPMTPEGAPAPRGTLAEGVREPNQTILEPGAQPEVPPTAVKPVQDTSLPPAAPPKAPPENFALSQAENIKRSQQGMVDYDQPLSSPQNMARKAVASDYRQAVENSIQDQAAKTSNPYVKNLAKDFVPAKERAGDLIAAHDVAQAGANRFAKSGKLGIGAYFGPGAASLSAAKAYGTSSVARGAFSLGGAMGRVGAALKTNPTALGRYAGALTGAFTRGGNAGLAAAHYTLSQSDPEYQAHVHGLPEGDKNE